MNKDLKRLTVETTANQVITTLNGKSWFFLIRIVILHKSKIDDYQEIYFRLPMVLHIAKVFIIIVSLEIPDLQKSSQIGLSF